MGATLSSPQLDGGMVPAPGPDAPGPFTSAFYVAASDTNSLGFTADMQFGRGIMAQYTDTASLVQTVTCSALFDSTQRDDEGPLPDQSLGSLLCPIANTQIGTGPVIFSIGGIFYPDVTSAIYVGSTTATVYEEAATMTLIVPGQTTYLATETATIFDTTQTVQVTTTLTGRLSATNCPDLPIPSPITFSTSKKTSASTTSTSKSFVVSRGPSSSSSSSSLLRSSMSSRRSSLSISRSSWPTKMSSSSSLMTGRSSSKASSSLETSSLKPATSKPSSTGKLSSTPKPISSMSSSKSATLVKTSSASRKISSTSLKTSTSKTSSRSTGIKTTSRVSSSSNTVQSPTSKKSSPSPVCSTGADLKSLSSYPVVASRLCQEIASTEQIFPSSISVLPASRLSSACSCFRKASSTGLSIPTKALLVERSDPATASSESFSATTPSDSSLVDPAPTTSSSTADVVTSISGYGPPTIYSVSTTTLYSHTQFSNRTADPIIVPTTTTTVRKGTTTVASNSTVTIDQRTLPTACLSRSGLATVSLLPRSSTCTNLKLHTALLWVMMKNPFDFCAYYLTANRNTSPLAEMSAGVMEETCNCLITHKTAPLPVFKVGPSYSPQPRQRCNQSVASLIKGKYKESQTFCKYYTSTSRSISPFLILKPVDLFAGCSCLEP